MSRHLVPVLLVAVLSGPLAGCQAAQDLAADARETVDRGLEAFAWCSAAFRLGTAVSNRDLEAGRAAAEDLQATAPDELRDELELLLDATADAEAGDLAAIDSDEVRAAGEEVLRTARERCDPTTDGGP